MCTKIIIKSEDSDYTVPTKLFEIGAESDMDLAEKLGEIILELTAYKARFTESN